MMPKDKDLCNVKVAKGRKQNANHFREKRFENGHVLKI
jgi:hypothetical protein